MLFRAQQPHQVPVPVPAALRRTVENCDRLPQLRGVLRDEFARAGGRYRYAERLADFWGEYAGLYNSAQRSWLGHRTVPKIEIAQCGVRGTTLVHELRHHQQTGMLVETLRRGSLHERIHHNTWIEADARAVEVLDVLERYELARQSHRRISKKVFEHCRHELANELTTIATAMPGHADIRNRFLTLTKRGKLIGQPEKLAMMRQTFDGYIKSSAAGTIPDTYRRTNNYQAAITGTGSGMTALFSFAGWWLLCVPFAIAASPASVSLGGGLTLAATLGGTYGAARTFTNARNKKSFTEKPPAAYAAILADLGRLPDGSANYMTQTQGPALDDWFYTQISNQTHQRIASRRAEVDQSLLREAWDAARFCGQIVTELTVDALSRAQSLFAPRSPH